MHTNDIANNQEQALISFGPLQVRVVLDGACGTEIHKGHKE